MEEEKDHCVDCGKPAIGERLLGMVGDTELVELVCYDHLPSSS